MFVLQLPFSDVNLQAIGDGAATSFFQVNGQGQVTLKTQAALTTDNETEYFVSSTFVLSKEQYI